MNDKSPQRDEDHFPRPGVFGRSEFGRRRTAARRAAGVPRPRRRRLAAGRDLAIQLPSNAAGKDFLPAGRVALAPSGSGFQVLPYGLIGILFAADEGLELNLLGLSLGVDLGQAGPVAAGSRQARDSEPINGSRRSL